jgi:Subtilase family
MRAPDGLPALTEYERTPAQVLDTDDTWPSVSSALLRRHGARVLDPTSAVLADQPLAQPTVYRAATLLMPSAVLGDKKLRTAIDKALAKAGMARAKPASRSFVSASLKIDDRAGTPQVPVPLTALAGTAAPVDAWAALQQLRAASAKDADLKQVIDRIRLEHLLFGGQALTLHGVPGGQTDPSGGRGTSLGGPVGYLGTDTPGPVPVRILAAAPPRSPQPPGGRRPVIAVPDSGIGQHPWLDVALDGSDTDAFVTVSRQVQDEIRDQARALDGTPAQRRFVIADEWDDPVTSRPLVGDVDSHFGHGTFVAGVIRQVAPDAQVLAIRVMQSDGVVYESDLLVALRWLRDRVAYAQQSNDPDSMVDVLSLSLGYYDESFETWATGDLATLLEDLVKRGVHVVAAAGNDATSREFLPAALAVDGDLGVISVGARNPNGSHALFSNEAPWVHWWAAGAGIVSTYPIAARGSRQPHAMVDSGCRREAFDPDDYSCGFVAWNGTSFAAPVVASMLADALSRSDKHPLRKVKTSVTVRRASTSLADVVGDASE